MRKSRGGGQRRVVNQRTYNAYGYDHTSYYTYKEAADEINYSDGRRAPSGHWPWKECEHSTSGIVSPSFGVTSWRERDPRDGWYQGGEDNFLYTNWTAPSKAPDIPFDSSVPEQLINQLDLNAGDSVMLYANVIQALPFLGGALQLSRICNRAMRKFGKELARKPFTTAIKSLISADFINRFVIRPTIDDARKFATATNYVLDVINTARERSSAPFAISAESKNSVRDEVWMETTPATRCAPVLCEHSVRVGAVSKAFLLLEAKYDVDSISPLKLWAKRTGFTTPLQSAWDLVPFSFVADYFTRGGDFIDALSHEMTDQDGLRGTVTKIHDYWCTHETHSIEKVVGLSGGKHYEGYPSIYNEFLPSVAERRYANFRRFRLPNPWQHLIQLENRLQPTLGDYLKVSLDLSQTRKRTIAELIIQAKL